MDANLHKYDATQNGQNRFEIVLEFLSSWKGLFRSMHVITMCILFNLVKTYIM